MVYSQARGSIGESFVSGVCRVERHMFRGSYYPLFLPQTVISYSILSIVPLI